MMKALFTDWQIEAERMRLQPVGKGQFCTCGPPGEPDVKCPSHGYEALKAANA